VVNGLDGAGVAVDSAWVTPITGQTEFILQATPGYDRRIGNFFRIDGDTTTYYTPIVKYQDTSSVVPGVWVGWDTSFPVDGSYSTTSQMMFLFDQPLLFSIGATADKTSARYETDATSLSLKWVDGYGSHDIIYSYAIYPTVSSMKTGINLNPGFDATGNIAYNAYPSLYETGTFAIDMTAEVFPGLKPCWVDYQTISDRYLSDRTSYDNLRLTQLVSRFYYLDNVREEEIIQAVSAEELLRASDGDWGNLYTWANNRFNRVQGCEAKLYQIKQMIARSQLVARANRSLV
jgi:hypothetical protein